MRSLNFEEVESLCVEVAEVSLDEVADAQNCKALMAVIQHPEMTGRMAPPASADLIKIVKDLILSLSASGEQRLHFRAALQTLSRLAEMNVTRNCRQPLKLSPLIGVPGISGVMDNQWLGFDQRDVHWDSQSSGATNRIGSQQEQSIHERCQRNVFELLSSPFTMVDVGAGLGIWSMTAAENNGMIHAFEPNPFTYEILRLHLEQNLLASRVIANELGVSSHSGSSRSYIEAEGVGPPENFSVQSISIDDYFMSRDVKTVDLIRIDESRHRLEILHGARNTIQRHHPLVYIPHAADIRDVNQWMAGMDYTALSPCNLQLRPDGEFSPENLNWDGRTFRPSWVEGLQLGGLEWDGFWLLVPNRRAHIFFNLKSKGARQEATVLYHGPFSESDLIKARLSINGQPVFSNFSSGFFSFLIPHRFSGLVRSLTVTVYLGERILLNHTGQAISCISDLPSDLPSSKLVGARMPRLSPHSVAHQSATHLLTVGHVPEKLNIAVLAFGRFRTVCLHALDT